ncbi:MAG: acetamidase/formamidase family protein [Eggerthellaceae bacterium]|nr:acetamidase/formamidase family protein [Eggerthellaceae bacterium]
MSTLNDDQAFYAFDPTLEPLLTVAQKEQFILYTQDCFANQLKSDEDTLDDLDWDHINPATGPVAIKGVKPGDVVRISIDKLEMIGKSVMTTIPGSGAISGITEATTRVMANSDGVLAVATDLGELKLPLKPMIGVIGLAPAAGSIPNGTPGTHGGNMDCNLIGEGASLYIRAAVEGGLFGCGDSHALMGDGEVLVCGAETPARVSATACVVEEPALPTPFVETADLYAAIASADSTDAAVKLAIDNMFDFLTKVVGLGQGDAGRLMSLIGNLRFCQVVDPKITIRFEFPKATLAELGFKGIGA